MVRALHDRMGQPLHRAMALDALLAAAAPDASSASAPVALALCLPPPASASAAPAPAPEAASLERSAALPEELVQFVYRQVHGAASDKELDDGASRRNVIRAACQVPLAPVPC